MTAFSPLIAASFTLPDISPLLNKAADAGNGVTLTIGDMYTWGLLGGGPLLILGGLALVKIMFNRVKFFALEYGNGGFFGRLKIIGPFVVFGSLLLLLGLTSLWLGWQSQGYSVTLTANGLVEMTRGESYHYGWTEMNAEASSRHIKSTDFTVVFTHDGRRCAARFQQRYIGEALQDKAIGIAEQAISSTSSK